MDRSLKILIADNHDLFRDALKPYLAQLGEGTETFEAGDFYEVVSVAQKIEGIDLVLLDLCMPGMNGIESIKAVIKLFNDIPIIIVSGYVDPLFISQTISAGAAGYFPKSMRGPSLLNAINHILNGESFIPPSALQALYAKATTTSDGSDESAKADEPDSFEIVEPTPFTDETPCNVAPAQGEAQKPSLAKAPHRLNENYAKAFGSLTEREARILELLIDGNTNKEIARILDLEEITIKVHLRNTYRKIGAGNRTDAVRISFLAGWAQLHPQVHSKMDTGQRPMNDVDAADENSPSYEVLMERRA